MSGLKQIFILSLLFFILMAFVDFIAHSKELTVSFIPQKGFWPPGGKSKRYEVIRDTGISSVGWEKKGNTGGAGKLKLKGQQEYILLDIDPASLKGKIITGALLHICSSTPENTPLMRVGVSSVASPWKEGFLFRYLPQPGSSCFHQAFYMKGNWAYPGSTLMDVVFGRGNTLWKFAEASKPEPDGWQSIAIDPDVVAARVAQLSQGFCLSDEVGSEWLNKDGVFEYFLFPNRFLYSRETSKKKPWIEIWTNGEDSVPPDPINSIELSTAGLLPGQVLIRWKTPVDRGGGKTLGFNVAYKIKNEEIKVPRYLIPMARDAGEEVVMYLQDLSLGPGQKIDVIIRPVDRSGNIGPSFIKRITTASNPKSVPPLKSDIKPFPQSSTLPEVNGINISIIDLLDKIDPVSGKMMPLHKKGYKRGNHLFNAFEKRIRLQSARNETISFQLNFSGLSDKIAVQYLFPDNPLLNPRIFEFSYVNAAVSGKKGNHLLPDPLVPLGRFTSIPSISKGGIVDKQKNHSLICELYIPHGEPEGKKRGKLIVSVGEKNTEFKVDLDVWDFTLPNKLSFVPEMNAYGTVTPFKDYEYYKLAHEHRTCLNRLPYGWNGKPEFAPGYKNDRFDWKKWDEKVGPILDGSAFAEQSRANEPVDMFYLPFNENWPVNIGEHYRPSYWADEAFAEQYPVKLESAFKAFAQHFNNKKWFDPIFQFYLNNKVTYRKTNRFASAPWNFDEPVNLQDFWALRWYGVLWQTSMDKLSLGNLKMWYRADVSYSQFGRNVLWGITDIEYLGGNNKQKTRMMNDRQVLHGKTYFAEYGVANTIDESNLKIVLWCLSAWFKDANGVLQWQTIGTTKSWETADQTALFYPLVSGPKPSVRLKVFTAGQQLIEYLTMVCALYDVPRAKMEAWFESLVKENGGKSDIKMIWKMKNRLGRMISNKVPEYRRSLVNYENSSWNVKKLPELGYVNPSPFVESSKPAH
jgi:hypothetical protein